MAKCLAGIQPICTGRNCEFHHTCTAVTKAGDQEFNTDAKTAASLKRILETTGVAKNGYRVRVVKDRQVEL